MQDRQYRAVARWIQELVGVPGGRERPGLCLAVPDDTGDDQVWVVERGSVCVRDRITEFASLMNRPRSLWSNVARDAAGERKLGEEPLHAPAIAGDVGIDLRIGTFQPCRRYQRWAAVTGTDDVDHVQVTLGNRAVEVGVEEIE